ncbi:MAG: hypothetical protein FIA97_03100 [Methylococcaceae bacterium]|nr:hypothetical protein [Methylococcaceae bacterium]
MNRGICALILAWLTVAAGSPALAEDFVGPAIPYRYTSIRTEACQPPTAKQRRAFDEREVGAKECPGVDGWQLFLVYTDDASWLEFGRNGTLWSTREPLFGTHRFGDSPNVASDGVEWLPPSGEAQTLIFHLEAREPPTANGPGKRVSKVAVISLSGESPLFCGLANTNEQAKLVVEKRDSCNGRLQRLSLP